MSRSYRSTHFVNATLLMLLGFYLAPQQTSANPGVHVKRDECQSGKAYNTSTGAAFNMVCNVEWPGYDLQVFFCPDFFGCLDECATWNTANSQQCVGVAWCPEKPGPVTGTSTCYLKWQMPGNGIANEAINSGQIVGIQSVVSFKRYSNWYSKSHTRQPVLLHKPPNVPPSIAQLTLPPTVPSSILPVIMTGLVVICISSSPMTLLAASMGAPLGIPQRRARGYPGYSEVRD